jgi:hypothetical protein
MAGINIQPNYYGVDNTAVRRKLFDAARRSICTGGYDTAIWTSMSQVLSPYKVLYNSAWVIWIWQGGGAVNKIRGV